MLPNAKLEQAAWHRAWGKGLWGPFPWPVGWGCDRGDLATMGHASEHYCTQTHTPWLPPVGLVLNVFLVKLQLPLSPPVFTSKV